MRLLELFDRYSAMQARKIVEKDEIIQQLKAESAGKEDEILSRDFTIMEKDEQIERLRDALEYYADGLNDEGEIARIALGEEE